MSEHLDNGETVGDLLVRASGWRADGCDLTAERMENRAERAVFGRIVTPDDDFAETPEPVAVERPRSWLDRFCLWVVRQVQA